VADELQPAPQRYGEAPVVTTLPTSTRTGASAVADMLAGYGVTHVFMVPAVLRRTSREIGSSRFEVAEALEQAALAELKARKPDRVLATNVEFWSAVVLDHAEIPSSLFTSMFTCARTAGWAAHILEQKREGRLIRPSAKYVGPAPRELSAV